MIFKSLLVLGSIHPFAHVDIDQSPYLADLHDQIQVCDDILANMETLLGGFQSNLGSIGSEIQVLQEKSLSLSTKLRNRKVFQAELGNFLDELVIPPELVSKICDSEVDETYTQYLDALNRKITFLSDKTSQNIPSVNSVAPELERLKNKVIFFFRGFICSGFCSNPIVPLGHREGQGLCP